MVTASGSRISSRPCGPPVQTVLIESANHDADLVTYEPDELHHVMRFALGCWQQMIDSQQYRSVLMYKNKGPLSGGSLVHPHMQIVDLEQEDGYAALTSANFEGIDVWRRGRISVNISTEPIMGFFEVNISAPQGIAAQRRRPRPSRSRPVCRCDPGGPALYPARTPRRSLRESYKPCSSTTWTGRTIARRCPRWVVSPTLWAIVWPRSMPRPRSISMLSAYARIWKRSYSKVNTRVMRTV